MSVLAGAVTCGRGGEKAFLIFTTISNHLVPTYTNMINCFTYDFDFSYILACGSSLSISTFGAWAFRAASPATTFNAILPFFFILLLGFSLFSTLMGPTIHHVAQNNAFGWSNFSVALFKELRSDYLSSLGPAISRSIACVQTSLLPQKKSGEETLLPIFSEGGGTTVHRQAKDLFLVTELWLIYLSGHPPFKWL